MPFVTVLLIVSLFVFLYCIFVLAKDDFLLLRKNVTLEQLFNTAFIGFFVGLFFARLVYVLEHAKPAYLNPLVFFLFPYFPGLSVTGGVVGTMVLVWFVSRKKLPFGRVFDIFSLSFFFAWAIGLLLEFIASWVVAKQLLWPLLGGTGVFLLLFILFSWLFSSGKLKDGNTGFIGFAGFAVLQFLLRMGLRGPKAFLVFGIEDVLLIFLFLGCLGMYIQQETLGGFYRSLRRK